MSKDAVGVVRSFLDVSASSRLNATSTVAWRQRSFTDLGAIRTSLGLHSPTRPNVFIRDTDVRAMVWLQAYADARKPRTTHTVVVAIDTRNHNEMDLLALYDVLVSLRPTQLVFYGHGCKLADVWQRREPVWPPSRDLRFLGGAVPCRLLPWYGDGDENTPMTPCIPPGTFARTVTHLDFGRGFGAGLQGSLPPKLVSLVFGDFHEPTFHTGPDVVPESVTSLTFGKTYHGNPYTTPGDGNVTRLVFGPGFRYLHGAAEVPVGVKYVDFGSSFNHRIRPGMLPLTLTHVVFGDNFGSDPDYCVLVPGSLPPGVRCVQFGRGYDQRLLPGVLPAGLTHVVFGPAHNQPLDQGVLPTGVTHVMFGHAFNQRVEPHVLHVGLIQVNFGHGFNQPVGPNVLPRGLRSVALAPAFDQLLVLPNGCVRLDSTVTH